ncbi:MAG: hypothetical protein AAGG81_07895, partial [Chlamydiota bacterium]
MNADLIKKKCPFCHDDAFAEEVEIEGEFPEDRLEIRCQNCGDFHLPSKILSVSDHSIIVKQLENISLDIEKISRINKYAHSEGKVILWLNSFDEVNEWEEIIRKYAHHYGGLR